jgi:hypothetical protein
VIAFGVLMVVLVAASFAAGAVLALWHPVPRRRADTRPGAASGST